MDREGEFMGRLVSVRRVNIPLDSVPVHVQQAMIAVEDRRFYDHNGTDWRGFFRATLRNIRSLGVREGFSTITMQAARNTFVAGRFPRRSLRQKMIELRLSRLMEKSLTKQQILELYLNAIYMGNGVYGVEAASRDLFNKSVRRVTLTEAALLAALPKAPTTYTPRRHPERALERRNLVLDLMVREGYVSADRLPGLKEQRIRIVDEGWYPDDSDDSHAFDLVRQIVDSVVSARDLDVSEVTVYTTLDPRAQRAAQRAVRRRAAAIGPRVEGAMVAIDPRNGDIRALVGGRAFRRGTFNRAVAARRQPGSAFKPFVYAAAMTAGYSPGTEVDDTPIDIQMQGRVWSPRNYGDSYLGRTTFRNALTHSANAATVRVWGNVGGSRVIEVAKRLGISSPLENYPSLALGAAEVTPLELATAYAPFANGGNRVATRLVRRIEGGNGAVLWTQESATPGRAMDPRDAYLVSSMLRAVVDYGTGAVLRSYGVRGVVAGKTGTTNDGSDVWFVGYTPTISAAFWFGFDQRRSLGSNASGGRLAAPAWAEFFTAGWRETSTARDWAPPPGMVSSVIDPQTGYLANEWCPARVEEWFKPGGEPAVECPVHGAPIYDPEWDWYDPMEEIENFTDRVGRAIRDVFRGRSREEERRAREEQRRDLREQREEERRRNERRNLMPPPEDRVPQPRFEEFPDDSG
ncbi:MAG TPA: PBP1A family penicillin-binding protein [Gemmatimonadaceae bacterium]|nr:PBP1A family penicillin-binding protein [Gemmatimonadaceae bacterium]